ncbi:MAG: Biotin carboxyl carrier protein of acetyl-CoA carboxylase [Ktedonobacterales bacterium]|jgi:acetyl-CoA carboxylase biotin carboxyl carrier protein|nr:MAG: Biotin carboxyl carrier protein of acetyl-CoA carboxylase [Ktedonobacterales bacterium]
MARERASGGASAPPETARQEAPALSIAEIRQLISLMNSSDIEEIAIEQEADGLKLLLRKPAPISVASGLAAMVEGELYETLEDEEDTIGARVGEVEIGAPLVGVFRLSAKPGSKPLVRDGDIVREGQHIGAIESLRVYNEVESSAAGRVKMLVSDGQPVEYGQPLFIVEPL